MAHAPRLESATDRKAPGHAWQAHHTPVGSRGPGHHVLRAVPQTRTSKKDRTGGSESQREHQRRQIVSAPAGDTAMKGLRLPLPQRFQGFSAQREGPTLPATTHISGIPRARGLSNVRDFRTSTREGVRYVHDATREGRRNRSYTREGGE